MDTPLLQTKLYIPQPRPELVPRPYLIERLNEGLPRKLTLIAAPAGFGKTSLVSHWLHQNDERGMMDDESFRDHHSKVAWLSLDEGDSELARFLSYTIAALQKIDIDLGQSILPLLQLSEPPAIETLMTLLINDIALFKHRVILIFDDYHLIQNLEVHQALAFLLDRLPPQLHLVILSREDPPFPLARLRVRQQINEIRSHDLQFSLEEATRFLNQTMRLDLQPEAIAALEQRTEGWIAGLQMAAIALQAHLTMQDQANPADFIEAFAGDDRYVVDYLIAEVLELQPPYVLDFLQQTSILRRFTVALCKAVTDQAEAGQILTYLEEANLFLVALDNRREWYRYHHLFGDLLYHRLKQTNPDQLARLHHRASRWYQEQSFIDDAIHHALAGEDYDYAADLIEQAGLTMVGQARLSRLQQWIVSLPKILIAERSYLSVLLAWISVLNRQPDQAENHLAVAEPATQNLAEDSILKLEIVCQIALLRGYISRLRYDLLTSITHIQQSIQFLPNDHEFLQCTAYLNLGGSHWVLGNFAAVEAPLQKAMTFLNFLDTIYPALAAAGYLTNAYLQQGRLSEATKLCHHVEQQLASRRHPPPAMAYVAIEQGALFYEQNDLTAATDCLSQAIKLGENLDRIVNIGRAFLLLAWIKQLTGQSDEAAALIEQANAHPPPSVAEFEYYKVRLWLAQSNLAEAEQWVHSYKQRRAPDKPWAIMNELTFAHALLAEKQIDQALEVLNQCETTAQAAGITGWVIRSLTLKALCYQALNDIDQALASLQQALTLAEPEGYRRTFIDHGPPMQRLLQQVAAQGIASTYVAQLLAAFSNLRFTISDLREANQIVNPKPKIENQYEPLNDRELSILRLLAAGLSNREIADELYLSTNTIKWYTTHIYSKLGVKKRAEAIDQAHQLGIL